MLMLGGQPVRMYGSCFHVSGSSFMTPCSSSSRQAQATISAVTCFETAPSTTTQPCSRKCRASVRDSVVHLAIDCSIIASKSAFIVHLPILMFICIKISRILHFDIRLLPQLFPERRFHCFPVFNCRCGISIVKSKALFQTPARCRRYSSFRCAL